MTAAANEPDEAGYLENRAEAELELAQKAIHPATVRAHYILAGHYLDRVHFPAAPDER